MPHHFLELAIVIFVAALAAIVSSRLKQLPFIGYVMAGTVIGPALLGIIENQREIAFIAEIGVILLLFILGIELPLKSFRQSYRTAVPATFALVSLSLVITFAIGLAIDLSVEEKIVYGFIIALSSTAVAVKLLEDVDLLDKGTGQIAVSILVAQDLLFVPMIMTINTLGGNERLDLMFIPRLLIAVLVLIGLIAFLSRKEKIHLLFERTVEKHQDLIPIAALTWCFVGAGISEYAGFSPAFGAFLAGLVIGNSHSRDKVLPTVEPLQSVFMMVFFLSIGMLIDFTVIIENWLLISLLLLGSMGFKTVASISLLKLFLPDDRWRCSFVTGLTISQIGEFSFILAAVALENGIFSSDSYRVIIAVIALSLAFSPLWMKILQRFVQIAYLDKTATALLPAISRCLRQAQSVEK